MPAAARPFGDLLREFRVRAGLSQSDLAERANISEDAVGALERGVRKAPYRATVALLTKALELSAQESEALEAARISARGKSARGGPAHNLVAGRTSFVGRQADVEHILKLLRRSRLVSIIGSGGVGKTRVVLETARRLLPEPFPEIWFVDFGPLVDGDFIAWKVAQAVQPPLGDRASTLATLASALAERHMLLIFDNCEHVIAQAARAADAILETCAHVSIVATSRERLNIAGEYVYVLSPLPQDDAEELLVERAEAAGHQFNLSRDRPQIVAIARHLEGIPLAVELAAAQMPLLGLPPLLRHLDGHFALPAARRDLPPRQQTLEATIRWSYELLTEDEGELFRRISVFSGGFTLEAAEAVCSGDSLDPSTLPVVLSSLVNKSLVHRVQRGDGARYSLLESVLSFARDRLGEAGNETVLRRRHALWLAAAAEHIENTYAYLSAEQLDNLVPDVDNVRSAMTWSLTAPSQADRALAGMIATGFFGLWDHIGRDQEHRQWVESALRVIDESRNALVVSYLLRDLMMRAPFEVSALDIIDRAVALCEQSGDRFALAKLHTVVAQTRAAHGMLAEAERSLEVASVLFASEHKEDSVANVALLYSRSYLRMRQGRLDDARADLAAAEAKALGVADSPYLIGLCYIRRSEVEYAAGDKHAALLYLQHILDGECRGDTRLARGALLGVINFRLQLGDVDGAIEPLRERLLQVPAGESYYHSELEYAALALALRGEITAAARIFACIQAREEGKQLRLSIARQDARNLLCSILQEKLGDSAPASVYAAGARLTPDEAIDEALAALDSGAAG